MVNAGFQRLDVDHCVYVRKLHAGSSIVGIHVDDMAAAASNTAEMNALVQDLQKVLDLVDMGNIKWFLGMEVVRNRKVRTISLSQVAYVDTIAHRFNLETSNPVSTPLDPNVILSKDLCPKDEETWRQMKKVPYLAGVGSLMYASMATCN